MIFNVVYLDDEQDLCEIFYEFLSNDETVVKTFTIPEDAINAINDTPPDLFFIDYRLPATTGDDVAKAVDKSIPKVLVTGDLSVQTDYMFDQKVAKPYQFSDIQQLIEHFRAKKFA
ncbi:response regulator [Thalassotalea ganghwensis]